MKRFLLSVFSPIKSPLLLLLIALVYFVGISDDITGDIGKIDQIVFSKEYRSQDKFHNTQMKSMDWCDTIDFKTIRVLLIGDSFSKTTLYPDYLANILQTPSAKYFSDNIVLPEELFIALCNANVDIPKIVVLESVEREFVSRLCGLDFLSDTYPKASVNEAVTEKQTDFCTFYKNKIIIKNRVIFQASLRDSLFTCPHKEKDLYFYREDLGDPNEEQVQTAISKLDTLFQLAKMKNVCLFYIVAADKYDVYQEFTINNKFPKKELLERFVEFENNPYFVNTRIVLVEKARQGVKDLYYADDTHWSPIGSQIVAEEIARRMDSLGVFQR